VIEVRDLWAGYGGPAVLRGITFSAEPGAFLGVLGPNACGKSTLVRVLSGVLAPERGSARIAGDEVPRTAPRELSRRVATVPQSTEIPFPFTGLEVVFMGRYPRLARFGTPGEGDWTAVRRALERTDTTALSDRLVGQVSGGERQRLILARALAQETPLILLDEATAAMDVCRKIEAFDLLASLNGGGSTILAVMHDLNLAALYCRRLLFLKEGEILAEGPTEEVFTKEWIEAAYGTPAEIAVHPVTRRPYAVFLPRGARL
jgi:iron complex transport system ATP-binding protein